MRYLLLTHICALAGPTPDIIRWPESWWTDLSAQLRALRASGFEVTVASPLREKTESRSPAREPLVDVRLAGELNYLALPGYRTMAQFLARRAELRRMVRDAAKQADIVQTGPGGHPMSLGQTIWTTLGSTGRKRIFAFWDDPIPAWRRYAASGHNPAKRLAKSMVTRRLETFCAKAIREADLVVAQNPNVQQRFARAWSDHCHTLFTTGLPENLIATHRTPDKRAPLRVLCFGNTGLTRGVDHLIRVFAKAWRLSAKIELDLAGSLIESAELTDLIRDEKIESLVRLHGKVDSARQIELLDQADLLVQSSLVPTSDPIIYLAAARGLPILTYQSGTFDQRLLESGAGLVVPRGEMNLLAQALLDVSRDRTRLAEMSARATAWARELSLDAVHRCRAKLALNCMKGR